MPTMSKTSNVTTKRHGQRCRIYTTENVFRFLSVEGGAMALIKSVKTVTKKDTGKQHENEPDDINADNNEEVQG